MGLRMTLRMDLSREFGRDIERELTSCYWLLSLPLLPLVLPATFLQRFFLALFRFGAISFSPHMVCVLLLIRGNEIVFYFGAFAFCSVYFISPRILLCCSSRTRACAF